jgi:Calcineurin-like phosphoesterase
MNICTQQAATITHAGNEFAEPGGREPRAYQGDRLKLGVLTDLHYEIEPTMRRSWINTYEPEYVEARLAAALSWFGREAVDGVVLLGDIAETGDPWAFDRIFRAVRASGFTAGVVGGNHDVGANAGAFSHAAHENSIRLLAEEPFLADDAELVGIAAAPVSAGSPLFRSTAIPGPSRNRFRVVATHFPLLSEAARLAEAGLPYPGDLTDRAEICSALEAELVPAVVFSGHIHSRCSCSQDHLLQFGFGAMIEAPFDAAIVEVHAHTSPRVDRYVHRLGPIARIDPVFTGEKESWQWSEDSWQKD